MGLELAYGLDYKNDENFDETPSRNAKALLERCVGINSHNIIKDDLLNKSFPSEYRGLIIIDPITAFGLCPHHFENITYNVSVGYIPKDRCIGLSKFARVVKLYASQPMLQEDFTKDLADLFYETLDPEGVIVVAAGQHNCMIARGVKQAGNTVTMSEVRGTFFTDPSLELKFYNLLNLKNQSR